MNGKIVNLFSVLPSPFFHNIHPWKKDTESLGDSKHWDSGVGSSSERTSVFSVSEGIRRFEGELSVSEVTNHSLSLSSIIIIIVTIRGGPG